MKDKQTDVRDLLLKGREREKSQLDHPHLLHQSEIYQKYTKGKIANPCASSVEFSRVVIHTHYDLNILGEERLN